MRPYTPTKQIQKSSKLPSKTNEPQTEVSYHRGDRKVDIEDYKQSVASRSTKYEMQKAQESMDYTYEQSFREAQRKAEDIYEQEIQSLENDKISLIKRLNLALVELDRITQEKSEVTAKLRERTKTTEDFERRLEQSNNLTGIITKNLQEDINYQRAQNEKLKTELVDSEKEKDKLLLDVRDQEESVLKQREELDLRKSRFKTSEEELKLLQDRHINCLRELKILTDQAEGLAEKEKSGEESKTNLRETLTKLEEERNELIYRMNDLTEKYELYVQAMGKERDEISKTNKKHAKLLTISILFTNLNNRMTQRLGVAMEHIQKLANYRRVVVRKVKELIKLQENFKIRLTTKCFGKWRHGELKWTRERKINKGLIITKFANKLRVKYFLEWRRQYSQSSRRANTQIRSAVRISELKMNQGLKDMRRLFNNWHKKSVLYTKREACIERLLLRIIKRYEQDALLTWLHISKKTSNDINLGNLADDLAEEQFKRQMFARLRHNIYIAEDKKIAKSQTTLDLKYKEKQRNRCLKASTLVFMNLNRKKQNDFKEEAFESMKFNILDEKKQRTSTELNKELPECSKIENDLKVSAEEHKAKLTEALLKASLLLFRRRLRYHFERWQTIVPINRKNNLQLKKVLFRWLYNKLGVAFILWTRKVHKIKIASKKIEEKGAEKEIESLDDAIKLLNKKIQKQDNHLKRITLSKLQSVAHMISRRFERNRIRTWRDTTRYLRRISIGGRKITKLTRKFSIEQGLKKYRNQIKNIKKELGNLKKVNSMNQTMKRSSIRRCFKEFRKKTKISKFVKKTFSKAAHRIDNLKVMNYISRWRSNTHTIISETSKNYILYGELPSEIDKTKDNISVEQKNKAKAEETISDWQKKERNQAVEALAKTFKIWENRRIGYAFNEWRNSTYCYNRKVKLLVRFVNKSSHNNLRPGLIRWRTYSFLQHMQEIETDLKRRVEKHDTFSKVSALKIDETEKEIKQLKETYVQLKNQHTIEDKKIEKISYVLGRLNTNCKRYSYYSNLFLAWVDMFRRERALQFKLKGLSTIYAGKHIYAILKHKADENKTKIKVEKAWINLMKKIAYLKERNALTNWRIATKETRGQNLEMNLRNTKQVLENTEAKLATLRIQHTYEREIIKRRTLKVMRAWQRQASTQILMQRKTEQLLDEVKTIRVSRSFNTWRSDVQQITRIREKTEKSANYYKQQLKNKSFIGWKYIHRAEVYLPKLLNSISKRHWLNSLSVAIEKTQTNSKSMDQRIQEKKKQGGTCLSSVLNKLYTSHLTSSLSRILIMGNHRMLCKSKLKSVFELTLRRKLFSSMFRWKQKVDEITLIEVVEFKGNTANKLREANMKYESLKEMVAREKITTNEFAIEEAEEERAGRRLDIGAAYDVTSALSTERRHSKKEYVEEKNRIMTKYTKLWIRKEKGVDLKGKFIDCWVKWINKRKAAELRAALVCKRIAHKEKSWAFDKLRNIKRAGIKSYGAEPRNNVINKIADTGRDIGLIKTHCEDVENNIKKLIEKNEKLKEDYEKGKRIAASVLVKFLVKPMLLVLLKWKIKKQGNVMTGLNDTMEEKKTAMVKLQGVRTNLEKKNAELLLQNELLKQSAMDGVEIANVMQKMTTERENLSTELATKGLTVKKLLQENIELKARLKKAEEEAEKLMKLSHAT